jgi:hypothetical protein
MDREVHKSRSFAEAERHDREQQWKMTPAERMAAAAELRMRVYGPDCPDVRDYERQRQSSRKP